jgi:hypothetical protein
MYSATEAHSMPQPDSRPDLGEVALLIFLAFVALVALLTILGPQIELLVRTLTSR